MTRNFLEPSRLTGRLFYCLISILAAVLAARAQGPQMTTVSDIVYRANGQVASGSLVVSWPAFTTADNKPVAAGELSLTIGAQGQVSVLLAPNSGSTPAGTFYKVVYKLGDGTTATEYWVVPSTSPATIASIRATVVPTQVGAHLASRQYVDALVASSNIDVVHKSGAETITGAKVFNASPIAPTPAVDEAVANKGYVDSAISIVGNDFVRKVGDSMSGPLTLPGSPATQNHAANKQYVDVQDSVLSAGLLLRLARWDDTPVNLAAVRYADQFAGATIVDRINAAYADLPGTGGTIYVNSGTYTGNTGCINFTTQGKSVRLVGSAYGWSSYGGSIGGGSKIEWNHLGHGICAILPYEGRGFVQVENLTLYQANASNVGAAINNFGSAHNDYKSVHVYGSWKYCAVFDHSTHMEFEGNACENTGSGTQGYGLWTTGIGTHTGAGGITAASRTSNVVTLTMARAHTLLVGWSIDVAGVTDAGFNGTFTVTALPTPTTITYAQIAANASSSGGTIAITGLGNGDTTNVVSISNNQFNTSNVGLIAEGGNTHDININNFNGNGGGNQLLFGSLTNFTIANNQFEVGGGGATAPIASELTCFQSATSCAGSSGGNIFGNIVTTVAGGDYSIDASYLATGTIQGNALYGDIANIRTQNNSSVWIGANFSGSAVGTAVTDCTAGPLTGNFWNFTGFFQNPASGIAHPVFGVGTCQPQAYWDVTPRLFSSTTGNGVNQNESLKVRAGAGQATSGTTGQTGGNGTGISITGGNGGTAPGGSTNGNGGSITLQPGAAGAGAGGAGVTGSIDLLGTIRGGSGAHSATGNFRVPSGFAFKYRNQTGSADLNALSKDASDVFQIGDVGGVNVAGPVTGTVINATSQLKVGGVALGFSHLAGNATKAQQHTATVYSDQANTYAAGLTQTFAPNNTNAGVNIGWVAGAPSTLANGDTWYDSTANRFKCRENGATKDCDTSGGGTTPTGTGFRHVASGSEDAAAVLINFTDANHVAANQGTTTTVLHGNASGQASFAAVSLTADISGTLGTSNGGTGVSTAAQGDILYASATDTWAKLAKNSSATRYLSNTGSGNNPAWAQVELSNGVTGDLPVARLNNGTNATKASFWNGNTEWTTRDNERNVSAFFCDFMQGVTGCPYSVTSSGTGATTASQASSATNRPGAVRMTTGTTATGRTTSSTNIDAMIFSGGQATWESGINLTTLSTSGERYIYRVGFIDNTGAGDHVDGAYLEYDESSSANWKCVTANNSVRTRNTSATAVAAATWLTLKVVVNAAGTSASFFVNGTELTDGACSPITTNIPTARNTGIGQKLEKSAGTTARTIDIDWERVEQIFTVAR